MIVSEFLANGFEFEFVITIGVPDYLSRSSGLTFSIEANLLVFLLPISLLSAYILITSMCLLKFSAYILLLLITTTTQLLYSLCLCRNKIRNNILTCALQRYWSWSSTFRHETVKRYAFEHNTHYLNIMILRDILNSTYIL